MCGDASARAAGSKESAIQIMHSNMFRTQSNGFYNATVWHLRLSLRCWPWRSSVAVISFLLFLRDCLPCIIGETHCNVDSRHNSIMGK